jgi:L-threonylcarbamoyladenylate synthase
MQGCSVVVDGTIKVIETMAIISTDIDAAAKLLSQDEVVAIPTETVYGLAGNGFSEHAVRKIFEVKERPFFNPLILHVSNLDMIGELVREISDEARELMKHFWPGPLTLVLPKSAKVSSLVSGNLPTVAVRVPNHPLALALLNKLDFPLAAPSANKYGSVSPTTAQHVNNQLGEQIPFILDGGNCDRGVESTIIGFENGKPQIFRLGAITLEEIEKVIPHILYSDTHGKKVLAPGMLPFHYSPKAKLILVDEVEKELINFKNYKVGAITFSTKIKNVEPTLMKVLSSKRNYEEATQNLYAALYELDALNVDYILAQRFPDADLGRTINNRLFKASNK